MVRIPTAYRTLLTQQLTSGESVSRHVSVQMVDIQLSTQHTASIN